MSDDLRINVTKLSTDGLNWVTYCDRMIWTFSSRRWSDHLTNTAITQAYIDAGNVNGQSPQTRWDAEEAAAKQLIASSVPDHVFNRIKTQTTTRDVWNTLRSLYQTRSKMIVVDLGKKLQGTKCNDDDDVRAHFTKLNDLREQLAAMGKTIDDDEYSSILL
jgi:gag-polypeptide of LTR copia-type